MPRTLLILTGFFFFFPDLSTEAALELGNELNLSGEKKNSHVFFSSKSRMFWGRSLSTLMDSNYIVGIVFAILNAQV